MQRLAGGWGRRARDTSAMDIGNAVALARADSLTFPEKEGQVPGWCDAFTLSTQHTRARGRLRSRNADYARGGRQSCKPRWENGETCFPFVFSLLAISATCQNVGKAISGRNVIYSLKVSESVNFLGQGLRFWSDTLTKCKALSFTTQNFLKDKE